MRILSDFILSILLIVTALPQVVLGFSCTASSNVTITSDSLFDPQLGNANFLKDGWSLPWPKIGDRRPVRYCYATDLARNTLHCNRVMPAMGVWAKALGVPVNAQNGHSLAWREANDGNTDLRQRKTLRCYGADYKDVNSPGTWNTAVEPDTLAIHLGTMKGGSATVGYISKEAHDDTPGRHTMVLGAGESGQVAVDVVVHELGHVLGMIHEQCRNDRDDYVVYRCEKVEGFQGALQKAIADGVPEKEARTKLCDVKRFAAKYGFMGSAFTKNDMFDRVPQIFDEGTFDLDSVMLYESGVFANPLCAVLDEWCTTMKIDKVNGKPTGTLSRIRVNGVPSAGDIAFVKKYYPWEGEAAPKPASVNEVRRGVASTRKIHESETSWWEVTRVGRKE